MVAPTRRCSLRRHLFGHGHEARAALLAHLQRQHAGQVVGLGAFTSL
jgi:hypothetical protein